MSDDDKTRARSRALRTAQVVTLGLALTGVAGCEQVSSTWCGVFRDSRYCCERTGYSMWNETTHRCEVRAVPGPIVAPTS